MYKRFSAIIVFVLSLMLGFTTSQVSHASHLSDPWSQSVLEWVGDYEPVAIDDPHIFSIWGSCKEPNVPFNVMTPNSMVLSLPSSKLKKNLPVLLLFPPVAYEVRELAVVIPGMFTGVRANQSRRLASLLVNQKRMVAIFPNPLSIEYVSRGPRHTPGDAREESWAYFEILQNLKNYLAERKYQIQKTRLMGISYGAFVSALMSVRDGESEQNLIDDAVLLSPPFNLYRSLASLDRILDETKPYFTLWPVMSYPETLAKICNAPNETFSKKEREVAKAILGTMGFQAHLADTVSAHDLGWPVGEMIKWFGSMSNDYFSWRKNLRFLPFIQKRAPQNLTYYQSEGGDVMHWIDRAEELKKKIRVVTCKDDFINRAEDWPKDDSRVILLERCGHYGLRSMPWFDGLIHRVAGDPIQGSLVSKNQN